jgi:hypothetical protein
MERPMGLPLTRRGVRTKDSLEISTQGSGGKERSMVKASNAGLMVQNLKGFIKKIRNTARVPFTWLIALSIPVSLGKESSKDLALIFGLMESNIKANGSTVKWKDSENFHGQTV